MLWLLWSLLPGPPVVCTEMPTCLQTLPLSGQLAHVGEYTFYTLSSRVCHFSPDWGLSRAKTLGNSDSVQFAHCYSRLQNLVVPLKAHISVVNCLPTAYFSSMSELLTLFNNWTNVIKCHTEVINLNSSVWPSSQVLMYCLQLSARGCRFQLFPLSLSFVPAG